MISGYLIVILCKINSYVINTGAQLIALIVVDAIFAILIIIWKIMFPKMEAKQISPHIK
jgi:hypothetical protein